MIQWLRSIRNNFLIWFQKNVPWGKESIEQLSNRLVENTPSYTQFSDQLESWKMSFHTLFGKVSPVFHTFVRQQVSFIDEDGLCIDFSFQVYLSPVQRQSNIGNYLLNTELSDEEHAVYVAQEIQRVVVAYRGTELRDFSDLMSDVQVVLGLNGIDPRVLRSLESYDRVKMMYPYYTIWVCGHSLGGTLSYLIAKHRNPDRCVVFNPGAAPNSVFVSLLTDTLMQQPWTQHTYTYKIFGDLVSTSGYVGHTRVFQGHSYNPLELHSLTSFKVSNP